MNWFALIKSDYHRYVATGARSRIKIILFNQGFFCTSVFRFNSSLFRLFRKVPIVNKLVGIYCLIWLKIFQILTGISLPVGLKLGKGIFIGHCGSIIINSQCVIGDNCNFAPGTIIGYGILNSEEGYPVIGNRVFIGAGAKIFGPVRVGNDAMIGANAVVNKDVPDKAVVVGVPAKIVSFKGSADYVKF